MTGALAPQPAAPTPPPAPHSTRPRGARVVLLLVAAAALALLGVLAVGLRGASGQLVPGRPAPDFDLRTFDGRSLSLAALRGRVVVLNFWASWCVECVPEAPELEAIWQDYGPRGVTVVGLAYTDTEPAARAFVAAHGLTFPSGPDRGARASTRYGLTGVPETVVIDARGRLVALPLADGTVAAKLVGPLVDGGALPPAALRALLDRLLDEAAADAEAGR